ncbi:uncharacterized protein LOC144947140 [Lampetra fluviatilis]
MFQSVGITEKDLKSRSTSQGIYDIIEKHGVEAVKDELRQKTSPAAAASPPVPSRTPGPGHSGTTRLPREAFNPLSPYAQRNHSEQAVSSRTAPGGQAPPPPPPVAPVPTPGAYQNGAPGHGRTSTAIVNILRTSTFSAVNRTSAPSIIIRLSTLLSTIIERTSSSSTTTTVDGTSCLSANGALSPHFSSSSSIVTPTTTCPATAVPPAPCWAASRWRPTIGR